MRVAEDVFPQQVEMRTDLGLSEEPRAGVIEIDLIVCVERRVLGSSQFVERRRRLIVRTLFELRDAGHVTWIVEPLPAIR